MRYQKISKDVKYEIAIPRMNLYMQYATDIYSIYLKYVSQNDIHVYSIDEAFLYITTYMKFYKKSAKEMAKMIMDDIFQTTSITATAGIGTNMYLAKVALDIMAKHVPDNIGLLTEQLYAKYFWHHTPITDFWHVDSGIVRRLTKYGITDMFGVAHIDEDVLYNEFGVNAEYLIDHAWGREPTTIEQIKKYRSKSNSLSNSQVLFEDYAYDDAFLVVKEMVELNVLNLVSLHLVTEHISLYIGYSKDERPPTGASRKLTVCTNSLKIIMDEFIDIFKRTTDPNYKIRRIGISLGNVVDEIYESYDLFTDYEELEEEKRLQQVIVDIKDKYGKNAVLKGMNYMEKATTKKRNTLVGGHNAQ